MADTIWITRHGNRYDFVNPDWFITAELPYDPHLAEDGITQAKQLGERLQSENITHIFSSPFLRTVQTAHEIAKILDLPIKLESGLGEWLNPNWMDHSPEIRSPQNLARHYPPIDLNYTSRVRSKYPEDEETVNYRTELTAQKLAQEFEGELLFVGHGASVLGTIAGLLGKPINIHASFCCLTKLVKNQGSWEVEFAGDTSHLSKVEKIIRFN
ncbi:histidine phosphatase family protein [Euhalothece natronophila Z-M001]|uniref:Histidine phosphatase family protein n=1 Tax=Euhalothece natronophila Z-M001 TaxID=522448 RepID=A0A5B8NM30_9CHRO|nr:histidine phosphatase family protein [Euhalothece natronophila]QDZ39139.1 histidine phosphatase family protein [Euhalothece natronophila Z-M001]